MLSGIFPFLNADKVETKRNIVTGKLNFSHPQWMRVSNDGKDLISRMLKPDLKKRLSILEIMQHRWFQYQDIH